MKLNLDMSPEAWEIQKHLNEVHIKPIWMFNSQKRS